MKLCGLYHGVLGVLKSTDVFCPCFSICFSILITSLGEEGAGLCASRTFGFFFFFLCEYVFVLFLFLLVIRVGCSL